MKINIWLEKSYAHIIAYIFNCAIVETVNLRNEVLKDGKSKNRRVTILTGKVLPENKHLKG